MWPKIILGLLIYYNMLSGKNCCFEMSLLPKKMKTSQQKAKQMHLSLKHLVDFIIIIIIIINTILMISI